MCNVKGLVYIFIRVLKKYANKAETVSVFCFRFISGCADVLNKTEIKLFYFPMCDELNNRCVMLCSVVLYRCRHCKVERYPKYLPAVRSTLLSTAAVSSM